LRGGSASGANAELVKAIPNGKFGSLREPWQSGELVVPLSVLNAIVLDGRVPRMVEESDLALRILVQPDARERASSVSAKSKKRRRKVDGGGECGKVGFAPAVMMPWNLHRRFHGDAGVAVPELARALGK